MLLEKYCIYKFVKVVIWQHYGNLRHIDFRWLNCKILKSSQGSNICNLYSISMGQEKIPNIVKVKNFAKGLILEYKEGVGFVDWCIFENC